MNRMTNAASARAEERVLEIEGALSPKTALWAAGLLVLWVFSAAESSPILCLLLGVGLAAAMAFLGNCAIRQRFGAQAGFVLAYTALCGASCYYADSGYLAYTDFLRLLPGFFVYWLFLWFSGRGRLRGWQGGTALSILSAVISFLSIDATGTRWFSGAFQALAGHFTNDYGMYTGLETGVRITSITENPNVYAGIAGLGVLLGLSLALGADGRGERLLHLCCLALNALGFVLVFSVGAAGFIVAAFAAFLLFQPKGERLRAAVLMAETLAVTMAGTAAVYAAVFDGTKEFSLVPLAAMAVCCAALCGLDGVLAPRLTAALGRHPRAMLTALLGVVLAAAVYAVAAMNVAGPAALAPGETLERAANLSGGTYTCAVESSGAAAVQIVSQNQQELILHTETELYSGAADGAAFTVPEDAQAVWFRFSLPEGGTLSAVSYSGTQDGALKLHYRLLPGFIANRLQGIWANENAAQRVQFWRDGLKLWQRHPVLGNGMGAMEVGLFSVASFYYETKYAHNHFVQCLMDVGAVGLVCFLGILVTSAGLFLRGRRQKERSPLLPGLGAGLVFMVLQATMQVDFSAHSFLPVAFGVFALLNITSRDAPALPAAYAAPAPAVEPQRKGKGKRGAQTPEPAPAPVPVPVETGEGRSRLRGALRLAYPVFGAVCALMLCCHFYANWYVYSGSGDPYSRMDRAAAIDPLFKVNYLQTYLLYGMDSDSVEVKRALPDHAARLAQERMNADPNYAVEYYFSTGDAQSAVDALLEHLAYNRARPGAWQYAFDLLLNNSDGSEEYRVQALRVADALTAWNAQSMEEIPLTDLNKTYLASLE